LRLAGAGSSLAAPPRVTLSPSTPVDQKLWAVVRKKPVVISTAGASFASVIVPSEFRLYFLMLPGHQ
jgi:hypothetical protein